MELIALPAGSGKIIIQMPSEWMRRALLEGGDKLCSLIEAVKEIERFDFKYVVYPELLKQREEEGKRLNSETKSLEVAGRPKANRHRHQYATIKKSLLKKGFVPYCIYCKEPKESL